MRLMFTKTHGPGNGAGIRRGLPERRVTVTTRGGGRSILWEGERQPLSMSGPAVIVFDGELKI